MQEAAQGVDGVFNVWEGQFDPVIRTCGCQPPVHGDCLMDFLSDPRTIRVPVSHRHLFHMSTSPLFHVSASPLPLPPDILRTCPSTMLRGSSSRRSGSNCCLPSGRPGRRRRGWDIRSQVCMWKMKGQGRIATLGIMLCGVLADLNLLPLICTSF